MSTITFKSIYFLVILLLVFISLIRNVQSVAVMSVDLGSEWMKIAIVSPGVPMEIILNTDSQRKTPLAVAFRDGERFIGDSALNVGIRFPEKTFTHFIDLLGKSNLSSIAVKKYQERFPYHRLVQTEDKKQLAFVLKDNGQEILLTPEELLSMMLNKARHFAETASASSSPTGQAQTITDCVLTVPPYFSQVERKALKHAAFLAGLKVLQLINVNSAFALNYGIFRRKDFNTSHSTNILFYDMGAGSTLATIASYQLVKHKERGFTETDPQLTIKGVAYDRYLGGFELQLRLRDHLLKLFSEQSKKTIDEIKKNKRAMAKLLKEAGRLKKVLSANQEHKAQIENVMNDVDLKAVVTRQQFETLADDLLNERITRPLDEVFLNSGYTLAEIDSMIIIGGATRIPKIQQLLQSYWDRELSKNINADEAGALGAAYQAAFLSKGFKVKTFHLKDYNLYQINVDFERELSDDEDGNSKKIVSRTLFARGNTFPQKKVITFSKNRKDFEFQVNYGTIPQDTAKTIQKIMLNNIEEIFGRYAKNESVEPKGIKVHFRMDESGILSLENSEASFEVEYEELLLQDNYDQISNLVGDAISRFGSKLTSLFGSNEAGLNETLNANMTNGSNIENVTNAETNKMDNQLNDEKIVNATQDKIDPSIKQNLTEPDNNNKTEKQLVKKEIKKKIIKERIETNVEFLDDFILSDKAISVSQEKLNAMNQREKDKLKRDQMKNALESFVHETRDKLGQDDYSSSVTDDERDKIENELRSVSEWLDYESDTAEASTFEEKLTKLHGLTKDLFERVREHRGRPEMLSQLTNMLNIADMFYANAINVTKDEQIFTEVELSTLRKLIDETKTWMDDSVKEQDALPKTQNPNLTINIITEKMALVDREVKYLLNKARITPPKKKEKKIEQPTNENNNSEPSGEEQPKEPEPESFPTLNETETILEPTATDNEEKTSSGQMKTEL